MIAKPSRGCGGEGIFLFKNKFKAPLLKNEFVVQKYIANPLLIEKKKFDLRLYVLIKKLEPMEAYFCNEGLVRFCTEDYNEPTDENIEHLYMHLTNFSLNKDSENYINPEDYGESNKGSKRLLSHFFKYLEKDEGLDQNYIKTQMLDTIKKTIITMIPQIKMYTRRFIKTEFSQLK